MEPQDRFTAALDEARRRRATLHDQLVHLEHATSSPASGRLQEWSDTVTKETVGLRDAFEQHVIATEKPGGLYEEIIERSPRLQGKVKRLHDEHPEITQHIAGVLTRLEAGEAGTEMWSLDNCRDDLQRLL